jgi:hypothetical protein
MLKKTKKLSTFVQEKRRYDAETKKFDKIIIRNEKKRRREERSVKLRGKKQKRRMK